MLRGFIFVIFISLSVVHSFKSGSIVSSSDEILGCRYRKPYESVSKHSRASEVKFRKREESRLLNNFWDCCNCHVRGCFLRYLFQPGSVLGEMAKKYQSNERNGRDENILMDFSQFLSLSLGAH
jgi:hypothetical protein